MLPDCVVSSIGTNNDITLKGFVVGEATGHLIVLLRDVEHTFVEMGLVGWNLFEEEFVALWSCNDVFLI